MYTLGAGVLGLLLVYFGYLRNFIKKKSEEIAEKKIKKYISTVVDENREKIVSIIESQDIELKVKKESNILVISEKEEDKGYLANFFNEVGINNFNFRINEEFKQAPNNTDLVIFDDRRMTSTKHELFNEYLRETTDKNILFVFFGDRFSAQKRENINFANSKYTLYNQVINSLKFKEIRKE